MTIGQLIEAQEIIEGETYDLTDKNIPTVIQLKLIIDREEPMDSQQQWPN